MPFPAHLPVRRVSVNSFGYGGTNAHIIVEEADSLLAVPQQYRYTASNGRPRARITRRALERNRPFLLPFSAHDKPTFKRNIEAHGAVVQQYNLLDLSYTLANCRTRFPSRAFAVTANAQEEVTFGDGLQHFVFADKKKAEGLAFVFTGQGAQWARMGAELMTYYPSFLQSIKRMDTVLEELEDVPEWTLEDSLLEDAKTSRVNMAEFSQPLCTAVQIALVQLLRLWDITPSVTCGIYLAKSRLHMPLALYPPLKQHFLAKLARMLMLNPDDFEEEGRSVASYGIDSMIGAELRNWIFKELGLDVSFQQLLGPTLTISKFAEQVCAKHGIGVQRSDANAFQ